MSSVRLFFAGDFCSKPSTSFISVSEELKKLIQSCDLKVINFEVPLKPEIDLPPQQVERFWQHDDAPEFLRSIGFNLFSMANNHAFDWGSAGYKKTKSVLGDLAFGAGTYDEAYKVKVCEINGVKVGFMAVTYAAYTGVFDDVLNHDGLGCAYINDLRVNHVIVEAKKQLDYLFILPHDGIEYIDVPLPETIARYRDFIDWGADGVIGSHPHCPQGWEEYKGRPIFYSLGNFFFNSKEDTSYRAWNRPHWYEGMCVEMTLSDGEVSYRIVNTKNIDNVSLVIDNEKCRNEHNIILSSYLADESKYCTYLNSRCRDLSKMREIPIIDGIFHFNKISTKKLMKNWVKILLNKSDSIDYSLYTLLKDDTRKNVLLRYLRERE